MRTKIVIVSLLVFMLLAALIPQVDADIRIDLSSQDEPTIEPITVGNMTNSWLMTEVPTDMCVTADGTIFTVNSYESWNHYRDFHSNTFVAWNSNGSVQWSQVNQNWERSFYGVTTDEVHVFVTGYLSDDLFIGKYDFQGNLIWNCTWDAGYLECGFDISLTDDGFIIVSACSKEYNGNVILDSFLLCFNSNGELVWEKGPLISYRISYHSGFVYVYFNNTLQKFRSDGTNVWSMDFDSGQSIYAYENIIYAFSYEWGLSQAKVMGLNPINGKETWSTNITFTDAIQQFYNISRIVRMITPDGSLLLVVSLFNREHENLLKINERGELSWNQTISIDYWSVPIIGMNDESRLCVSGLLNQSTVEIAVYDLSSIPEYTYEYTSTSTNTISANPLDIPMIGMTIAGVALIDAGLIIFLKRKYEA